MRPQSRKVAPEVFFEEGQHPPPVLGTRVRAVSEQRCVLRRLAFSPKHRERHGARLFLFEATDSGNCMFYRAACQAI